MTSKQKDDLSLERAYLTIIESATKCSECGCNPAEPKEGCDCEHHNEEKETVAEAKGKKPDWLVKVQKKAEGRDEEEDGEESDEKASDTKKKPAKKVDESLEQAYNRVINESKK